MAKSNITKAPDTIKAAPIPKPPVPKVDSVQERTADASSVFGQRAVNALGGGSVQTPPKQFGAYLGQMQGATVRQRGVLRQLQRSYGNQYVGKVLQAKSLVQAKCGESCSCSQCSQASISNTDGIISRLGNGSQMPRSVTRPFEIAYGASFSDVRLHQETSIATQLGVDALAVDKHVAFRSGKYQPRTLEGQHLIGHELAHVVQQARGGKSIQGQSTGRSSSFYEREADQASSEALAGHPVNLSAAPVGTYGGQAGGCFIKGLSSRQVGELAHAHIQRYFNATGLIYSEVNIPGARYIDSDRPHATGRCDLLLTYPPPTVVPNVSQPGIRPGVPLTSPPAPSPAAAMIGEIKPISYLGNQDAQYQLLDYIDAHNRYYGTGAGFYAPITYPMSLPIGGPLASGDPTFITWPPQALHVITLNDGLYYYFCRPLGELLPIMEWMRRKIQEYLRNLRELMRRYPQLRPQLEPVLDRLRRLGEALERALEGSRNWLRENFWELVLIVLAALVVALVIVFAAKIIAAIAAVGALLKAIGAALAAALAALAIILGTSETQAQPSTEPPSSSSPPIDIAPEPGHGCFTGSTLVTLADGTKKRIDQVCVGDAVIAWDEETGVLCPSMVLQTHRHPPEPLIKVKLSDNRELEVTYFHTIRTTDKWLLSRDLKPGDNLLVSDNSILHNVNIVDIHPLTKTEPVYNFTVQTYSTYLAGDIVVHNAGMAKPQYVPPSPEYPTPREIPTPEARQRIGR